MPAVREMLAEGSFHEATVEQVADRAGVSRATVYQHFASRLDLIDAICDVMGVNPALVEIREVVVLDDPARGARRRRWRNTVRFWSSESAGPRASSTAWSRSIPPRAPSSSASTPTAGASSSG